MTMIMQCDNQISVEAIVVTNIVSKNRLTGNGGPAPFSDRKEFIAYAKGFRVLDDGTVRGVKGGILKCWLNKSGYYVIGVKVGRKTRNCSVHRLCAYQKFGDAIFSPGIHVRHLDGNSRNNKPFNITIGTPSDNAMDKSPSTRMRASLIAAAANRKWEPAVVFAAYQRLGTYQLVCGELGISSKSTVAYAVKAFRKSLTA